jgi:hypothetical protein
MEKIDPYKHKELYLKWKVDIADKVPGISEKNSRLILDYLGDMEMGINVSNSSKKGGRSYSRLNSLRLRMIFLANKFEELYDLESLVDITERQLHKFFSEMRSGVIQKSGGGTYKSTCDFVKNFKAFWHWYSKVNRKRGIVIEDITQDLDTSRKKPQWVYLTEEEVKKLCDNTKFEHKTLIMFLFDSGIRAPTECQISNNFNKKTKTPKDYPNFKNI